MEVLHLRDREGRAVSCNLWQSLTDERVWHAELQFEHEGEWLYVDLLPLDELESGFYESSDGSVSMSHIEIVNDEPIYGPTMTLSAGEVERLVEWAREQLRVKPQKRRRPSVMAERVLAT